MNKTQSMADWKKAIEAEKAKKQAAKEKEKKQVKPGESDKKISREDL